MARPDRRLLRLDPKVGIQLGMLAVLALATALLVVAQAHVLAGALAATINAGTRPAALTEPIVVLLVIVAGRAGLAWLTTATAGATARHATSVLRAAIARRVLVDDVGIGGAGGDGPEVTVLLARGLDGLDGYFTKYLPQLVAAVVVPLVVGLAILGTDVTSAVVIGVTLPLIPLFMVLIGLATRDRERRSWRALARLAHHFADLLAGLPTLKVFGRARSQVEGLRRTSDVYRTETMGTLRLAFCSALVLELGSTLAVALVAVGIGLRLLDGAMGLDAAFFVLLLAPEVFLPVRAVGLHYHESAAGMAVAERAFEILDTPSNTRVQRPATSEDERSTPDGPSPVVLDGVTVTYPGRMSPALEDVCLRVDPGEIVALTGASGAGKSTVLALLLGLVEPTAGRLTVGGLDLDTLQLQEWRQRVAWLPQHPTLFAATIADNVRLGTPSATDAQVLRALERAGASALDPERLVGERGEGLSVGERRRIGLARALVRVEVGGAWLLLVDEPTAGLDPATEETVIRAALSDPAGRAEASALRPACDDAIASRALSVLMVTHRAATAAAADRVVRLAERPRAESGSRDVDAGRLRESRPPTIGVPG